MKHVTKRSFVSWSAEISHRYICLGYITPADFTTCVRMLGANPSEKEVAALKKDIGTEKIDFDTFVKHLPKALARPRDTVEELMECFQVFDKDGNGYISIQELKHIYCGLGEKFSDEEFDDMQKSIDDGSGMVAYEDFAKMMLA